MAKLRTLTLTLDELDYRAIERAIRRRINFPIRDKNGYPILPDGESDQWGAAVAEVCRGWEEFLDLTPIR